MRPKARVSDDPRFDAVPPALAWLVAQAEARERRPALGVLAGAVAGIGALAVAWSRARIGL